MARRMKALSIPMPSPRPRARRSERGFTLLEIMLAVGVFGIGLIWGAIPLLHSVVTWNGVANDTSMATNIGSATLEQLALRDFATLTGTETRYYSKFGDGPFVAADTFAVQWTATPDASGMFTDVLIEVRWKGGLDTQYARSLVFEGRVSKP